MASADLTRARDLKNTFGQERDLQAAILDMLQTAGVLVSFSGLLVDDAAFTPAASSILPAGFTFDDVAPDSVNEGDIGAARMSANRNIYFTMRDAAGNERGVNINASNELEIALAKNSGVVGSTVVRTVEADDAGPQSVSFLASCAANNNLTNVKASAAVLYELIGYNAVNAVTWIKLYNKASTPVIASDNALLIHRIPIPPLSAFELKWPKGFRYGTGLGYGIVAAAGTSDTATNAPAAGDVTGLNVGYR